METNDSVTIKQTFGYTWRLFKLVWKHNKLLFSTDLITSFLPTLLSFLNLYINKYLIDAITYTLTTHQIHLQVFYWLIGLKISSSVVTRIANSASNFTDNLVWIKMPNIIQDLYITHISSLNQSVLEDSEFRTLTEKASRGMNFQSQQHISTTVSLLQSFISAIGTLWILTTVSPFVIFVALVILIPEIINQTKMVKIAFGFWEWNSPLRKKVLYLTWILQHNDIIQELKLYGLRNRFLAEARKMWSKFYEDNKLLAQKSFVASIFNSSSQAMVLGGIEAYFIFLAVYRKITLGDVTLLTSAVNNFNGSIGDIARRTVRLHESTLYLKSMFQVLDTKSTLTDAPGAIPLPLFEMPPVIKFSHVSFFYPKAKHKVLDDFSLTIEPGQKIALVGENGAGKTTIVNLLARVYDITEGEILINDIPLKKIQLASWYKNLGILFQGFSRFEYTLKENIHFGDIDKEPLDELIIDAAKAASADEVAESLENKYDQMLGKTFENGVELSGGQWQRVSLARAFFKNAPVLVLDEPAAAIDAKAEAEIFDKVQKLSKNKTVIIISHRFSTVRHADIIYVIDKGKIIESGNHEQLMKKNNGKYKELFTLQAKGYQ